MSSRQATQLLGWKQWDNYFTLIGVSLSEIRSCPLLHWEQKTTDILIMDHFPRDLSCMALPIDPCKQPCIGHQLGKHYLPVCGPFNPSPSNHSTNSPPLLNAINSIITTNLCYFWTWRCLEALRLSLRCLDCCLYCLCWLHSVICYPLCCRPLCRCTCLRQRLYPRCRTPGLSVSGSDPYGLLRRTAYRLLSTRANRGNSQRNIHVNPSSYKTSSNIF